MIEDPNYQDPDQPPPVEDLPQDSEDMYIRAFRTVRVLNKDMEEEGAESRFLFKVVKPREKECINDNNGDGDCAACANNPDALCRKVVRYFLGTTFLPPEEWSEVSREVYKAVRNTACTQFNFHSDSKNRSMETHFAVLELMICGAVVWEGSEHEHKFPPLAEES